MKRTITTAIFSVLVLVSQAQFGVQVNGSIGQRNYHNPNRNYNYGNSAYNGTTSLYVSSFDNAAVTVLIDGNIQSGTGQQISINFQQAGNHHLIVSKVVQNRRNTFLQEIYNGYVNLQAGTTTYASVDSWGQLNFGSSNTSGGNCNTNRGGYHNQNPNGYNNYNAFMDGAAFSQLKQSIQSKGFDSSKEQVAMQAMSGNNLSAKQVRELLDLFSFETTKLKVAKAAFLASKDRGNFYVVNDAFSFSSSIDELDQFIGQHS